VRAGLRLSIQIDLNRWQERPAGSLKTDERTGLQANQISYLVLSGSVTPAMKDERKFEP
jgi:hypothetical protein